MATREDVKLNYSNQAEILIKNMPKFDRADFESWFFSNLPVGSSNIQEYLHFKEREIKDKEKK